MADKTMSIDAAPKAGSIHEKPEWHSSSSIDDATFDADLEKKSFEKGTTVQLKRRLQSRHLQMIAIGSANPQICMSVSRSLTRYKVVLLELGSLSVLEAHSQAQVLPELSLPTPLSVPSSTAS